MNWQQIERTCEWCDHVFTTYVSGRKKFCSKRCRRAHRESQKEVDTHWADRLHDGSRLQSDDFGQRGGDEFVTFEK